MTNPYKMDTELKNTSEDTELTDCDGEKVVTMMDVLQEQEDFEEDVNAVLGASDEKDCTYSKGYIKRQAIYACMTCCSDAKSDPTKRAGVCLACSLTCHENHDLIELYTKRNFRCDCGNPKFNSHPCQFTPDKTDLNEENNYNQNFSGVYCVCQRPYPDPESTTEVEMIQCIICEDWLHASHLEATVPDNDQYSEMICKGCMGKNEFLHDYGNLAVNIDVDVITNGVDDDKMCNGDDIPKVKAQDETVKAEQISEKVNGDDSNKNEENLSESKEFSEEKKDEKSVDIPMETGESKQLDLNSTTLTEESSERVNNENNEALDTKDKEETIQDIDDKNTKDATIEKAIDSETVHQEQQNENKESATDAKQTESTVEVENPESVNKNAEQLEEERLLADPDDYNKKSNAEKKDDIKEENNVQNMPQAEDNKNSETPIPEATNENMANNDLNSDDKKDESQTNEDSTVSEKQVEEQTTENPPIETKSSAVDISATAEVEMKDDLKENYIGESKSDIQNGDSEVKISEKRKLSTEENSGSDIKKQKLECVRPKGVQRVHKGATFWPSTFRQKLCTCWECITMYKDLSVLFLIDPEDTVTAYENLGKQKINGKPISQYEKGLQALSSLDRIQQINALTEYNKMRDKLLDFLKSFKDRREVVKEEDIKAFFAGMKPKREPDGVYFCR